MRRLRFSKEVMNQIVDTIGKLPPECGGILGAGEDGIISHYYFDYSGRGKENGYAPDICAVNNVLVTEWMPRDIIMVGIVHSHSNGIMVPSCGDVAYGVRILQALDTVNEFYIPIVTIQDGIVRLSCYGIFPDIDRKYVCRAIDFDII